MCQLAANDVSHGTSSILAATLQIAHLAAASAFLDYLFEETT